MRHEREQDIQRAILDLLALKGYVAFKHHSTGIAGGGDKPIRFVARGEKGVPDIIACSPTGRFVGIEVKRKYGKASPEQLAFLERIRKNGGIGIVAFSIDDVISVLGS